MQPHSHGGGSQRSAWPGTGPPPASAATATAPLLSQPAGSSTSGINPVTPSVAVGGVLSQLESQFDLLGKIGEGTYGVVYLAASKDGGKKLYAIKKFKTGRVRGEWKIKAASKISSHRSCIRVPSPDRHWT
jgi:serine/threonine protein kinase